MDVDAVSQDDISSVTASSSGGSDDDIDSLLDE